MADDRGVLARVVPAKGRLGGRVHGLNQQDGEEVDAGLPRTPRGFQSRGQNAVTRRSGGWPGPEADLPHDGREPHRPLGVIVGRLDARHAQEGEERVVVLVHDPITESVGREWHAADEGVASEIGPTGVIDGPSVNVPEPLLEKQWHTVALSTEPR